VTSGFHSFSTRGFVYSYAKYIRLRIIENCWKNKFRRPSAHLLSRLQAGFPRSINIVRGHILHSCYVSNFRISLCLLHNLEILDLSNVLKVRFSVGTEQTLKASLAILLLISDSSLSVER